MKFWLDAQLSPSLAIWISEKFKVECQALRDLNIRDAEDKVIFSAAKSANATVITKDKDFVSLLTKFGPPPTIIWITCGNTSNMRMQQIFDKSFLTAISLLTKSESLVEISDYC